MEGDKIFTALKKLDNRRFKIREIVKLSQSWSLTFTVYFQKDRGSCQVIPKIKKGSQQLIKLATILISNEPS
jgi:hypothetical protein